MTANLQHRTDRYVTAPTGVVASFDVFDTLLVRASGGPLAHFEQLGRLVAERLGLDIAPARFARTRARVEAAEVRRVGGVTGVRLCTIAARLAVALGVPQHAAALQRAELELEREVCRPNPLGVRALQGARRRGDRVLFLSDTYYGVDELTELLTVHDLFEQGDLVVTSSCGLGSKHDSRLYAVAAARAGVGPAQVHHVGNDARSDGRNARRQQVPATLLPEGNLTRFESVLDAHPEATALSSALAGASRLARLTLAGRGPADPALDAVAAGVGGSLVVGYLLWALHQAEADGVRRLLFVSREGALLAELAAVLAAKAGLAIECRSVPGGRAAWTAGALDADRPAERAQLLVDGSRPFTAATVLHRLALDPATVAAVLGALPAPLRGEVTDDEAGRLPFVRELLEVDAVRAAVAERSRVVRAATRRWFEEQGLFDGVPSGLVDPGCGATLLQLVRAQCGDRLGELPGYYLGSRSGVSMWLGPPPRLWLFDQSSIDRRPGWVPEPISQRWSWPFIATFEMVTAAAIGSMAAYCEDPRTGRLGVRHEPALITTVVDWGLDRVHDALRLVAEHLPTEHVGDLAADVRGPVAAALQAFFEHPTFEEGARWGAFPLEDGWGGSLTWQPFGAPFRPTALRFGPKRALKPHRLHWIHGSLAASNRRVGPALASVWAKVGPTD